MRKMRKEEEEREEKCEEKEKPKEFRRGRAIHARDLSSVSSFPLTHQVE